VKKTLFGCDRGYLLKDINILDHRPLWIDVPYTLTFGYQADESSIPQQRKLNSNDPPCSQKYVSYLRNVMQEKGLFNQMAALLETVHQGRPLSPL